MRAPTIDGISKAHVSEVSRDEAELCENTVFEKPYVEKSLKENVDLLN